MGAERKYKFLIDGAKSKPARLAAAAAVVLASQVSDFHKKPEQKDISSQVIQTKSFNGEREWFGRELEKFKGEEKLPRLDLKTESPQELRGQMLNGEYQRELPLILAKLSQDPGLFDQNKLEDLKMYYPMYRAAQDKTGLDWYLVWIVHEDESTASRDPNAFLPGVDPYGAMQRVKQFHPDSDVVRSSQGWEFLATLPQRHADDWREIIWGAEALKEYAQSSGSVLGGLKKYSALKYAVSRYERYESYKWFLES